MNVIIMDDQKEALLQIVNNMVDLPNISISIFKDDYQEVLSYASKNNVDLALLDIEMPSINGITLALKLIKINKNIKIVFITGYTQDINIIQEKLKKNFYGFYYKPYSNESLIQIIMKASKEKNIYFKMFPRFDLMVNNVLVNFKSSKAKELLALLADRKGLTLTIEEAISKLWPDKDPYHAKKLYRDAVSRLKLILEEYDIGHIVCYSRAKMHLDTSKINCDYYNYLKKLNNDYNYEYLRPYDWSIETENYLNCLKEKEI
jgi:two-component SAPR family response regulator